MSLFQTNKPKSAGKIMISTEDRLADVVLSTLDKMATLSGGTLGPLGRQVLIERSEMELKPIISKDGVTVIKNMGYQNPVKQLILEAARDAAIQTANDAGDGTTTATILSASIARQAHNVTKENPRISPQSIVREMKKLMPFIIEKVEEYKIDMTEDNFWEVLYQVAKLSANSDEDLATAVMEAFDLVGDEGNITIVDRLSPDSNYTVEKLNGFTIEIGYEQSCRGFAPAFINERDKNIVNLKKPVVILYNGKINSIHQILGAFEKIDSVFEAKGLPVDERNVVVVAHEFADSVLDHLYVNWTHERSKIKIFPMLTQTSMIMNYEIDFLYDLQAYTGSPVYDPGTRSVLDMDAEALYENSRVQRFECSRFRSSIICEEDPDAVEIRVEELKTLLKNPESDLEKAELQKRIGKLTSGIAKLVVYAPSAGEGREKRDRAEDAWMAIRGAAKNGATPGGGYVLVQLSMDLLSLAIIEQNIHKKLAMEIMGNALLKPVEQLYYNYGWKEDEVEKHLMEMTTSKKTYDLLTQQWVEPMQLLDSAPALIEAVRNSLSIASLLGTLGGVIAFSRDKDTDLEEQMYKTKFERTIGERQ